jgi:hypothetical protein
VISGPFLLYSRRPGSPEMPFRSSQ